MGGRVTEVWTHDEVRGGRSATEVQRCIKEKSYSV